MNTVARCLKFRVPAGVIALLLFAGALALRLTGLDHGVSFHPDERHVIMVAERLSWEEPNPGFFAYGSFPFYLLGGISSLIGKFSEYYSRYDGLFIVGRGISAVFGAAAVVLTWLLAQAVFRRTAVSIVAALLLLFNPLHLQLSHFYAFDVVLVALNLLALYAMVRLVQGGWALGWVFVTALSIGVSIATKISAVWLFCPLALVWLKFALETPRRAVPQMTLWLRFVGIVVASLLFFLCAEPYALLDYEKFLKDNQEQLGFVRGAWRPPYGVQYENTTPFLYPLQQMFSFTMGAPVLIAALAGVVWRLCVSVKRRDWGELLLLAWVAGVFLSIAGLRIKFPRYLLPIYPLLLLFAAVAIVQCAALLRRYLGAWASHLLVYGMLIYVAMLGLATMSVYSTEHAYVQASRWIYEYIPPQSKILHAHWDDTLPLHLPDRSPSLFRTHQRQWEMGLYETDTPAKMDQLATQLSDSDYLIFPTQRMAGSILRVPDEYRDTSHFLQLLYAGKLGYTVAYSFKVSPQFGPLIVDTDVADESISVYDHPRVMIFQNAERLSKEELLRRIQTPEEYAPLPSREEILRTGGMVKGEGRSISAMTIPALAVWLLTIEILGLACFCIFQYLFRALPDRGFGLSKALGLLLFGYVAWVFPVFGFTRTNAAWYWIVALAFLAAGAWCGYRRRSELLSFIKSHQSDLWVAQGVYLGVYLVFAFIRSCSPEIFWGEKPMDFTFLNFFMRNETLPPVDPWSSGHIMRYYYVGTYIISALLTLTGIEASIGYNLALALIPALLVVTSYSLLLWVLRSRIFAAVGGMLVIAISNFEVLYLTFFSDRKLNFDLFWATTRLFRSPGITEYPLWSILFADLHAHVIALPFTVLLVIFGVHIVTPGRSTEREILTFRALYGFVWGMLFTINSWDFITYGFFTAMLFLYRPLPFSVFGKSGYRKGGQEYVRRTAVDSLVILGTAALVLAPFYLTANPEAAFSWGWVYDEEFNNLGHIVRHVGVWLIPILIGLVVLDVSTEIADWKPQAVRVVTALCVAFIPFAIAISGEHADLWFGRGRNVTGAPLPVLALSALFAGYAMLVCWMRPRSGAATRLLGALLTLAALLIGFSEQIFIVDRMNTQFKFYNGIWVLLALSAALLLRPIWFSMRSRRFSSLRRGVGVLAVSICGCVYLTGFSGSILNSWVMGSFQRTEQPRLTLDGTQYLRTQNPEEYEMIRWIQSHISGTPVTLEAQLRSYEEFTRISMHTGLPTLLGWDHHVRQRGTPGRAIDDRQRDIKRIYSTDSAEEAYQLLSRYDVDLVVIGKLERKTYGTASMLKFLNRPDLFPVLFRRGDTVLLARRDSLKHVGTGRDLHLRWTTR